MPENLMPGGLIAEFQADDESSRKLVEQHLARILNSPLFSRSDRLVRFLRFSVQAALNSDCDRVKEYVIGVEVFDRGSSFDPRIDPVVRVEARRLRSRLKRWHETEGRDSAVLIELPTGGYAARISYRGGPEKIDARPPSARTIAVLPFTNLNHDSELDYFSDGLTEELIHALTRLRGLHVVAWPSVSRLKGQEREIATVGEKLNVENILRGSVRRSGNRLRMTAQLINAADGHYLWSEAWDRPASDLLSIEQEIALAIANKLRLELGEVAAGEPFPHSRDPEAHMLYLKGLFQLNKRNPESLQLAIGYFKRAVETDPSWPLAWAGLSDVYGVLASNGVNRPTANLLAARETAEKALALDPYSAEATTCLAFVRGAYDRDWTGAEALYRRAIALNPNYATAHHWYGIDFMAVFGRFDEAAFELETALRLDPLSSIMLEGRGLLYLVMRKYDKAHQAYRELVEHDPSFFKGWSALGRLYTTIGRYEDALTMFEKARLLAGDFPKILGALGQTYALSGQPDEARRLLNILRETSSTQYVGGTTLALVHLGLEEKDAALDCLESAIEDHETSVLWLNRHPAWDALRSESRFQSIVRHIGLA